MAVADARMLRKMIDLDILDDDIRYAEKRVAAIFKFFRSNPIEQYFSQMKHYLKKESPVSFADIKKVVGKSIAKVKERNYNNYFLHAFRSETLLKTRKTRRRTPKVYKN